MRSETAQTLKIILREERELLKTGADLRSRTEQEKVSKIFKDEKVFTDR
jgi:hypothetical protein